MKAKQMRELVIKPALERIDLAGEPAETLLLATACVESRCGAAIKQWPSGPALGIFQIEPATYHDLQCNFLEYRPELKAKLMALYCEGMTAEQNLTCNLIFRRRFAGLSICAHRKNSGNSVRYGGLLEAVL